MVVGLQLQKIFEDEEDLDYAENMDLTTQYNVYEQVGRPVMSDLLHGHSVVLFAYGLSGSGKTYTVFGPDDQRQKILGTNINLYTSNGFVSKSSISYFCREAKARRLENHYQIFPKCC